ncbi:hypothetical protein M513_10159 [Trichuris suis]|uniref:Uncharacterized protein n=1 Tax=Trichuris suis TaxID=68888 RepID=A0A085LVL1_9BILA|nr:hypothetical protein M513_10159 [Trichuris suis]
MQRLIGGAIFAHFIFQIYATSYYVPDFTKYDRMILERREEEQRARLREREEATNRELTTDNNNVPSRHVDERNDLHEDLDLMYMDGGDKGNERMQKLLQDALAGRIQYKGVLKLNKNHHNITDRAKSLLEHYVTYCNDCNYWMGITDMITANIHLPSRQLYLSMNAVETTCSIFKDKKEYVYKGYCGATNPLLECSGFVDWDGDGKSDVSCCRVHQSRLRVEGTHERQAHIMRLRYC